MNGYFLEKKLTMSIQNIEVWVENSKKRKSQIYYFKQMIWKAEKQFVKCIPFSNLD